jgi:hypothetical protein
MDAESLSRKADKEHDDWIYQQAIDENNELQERVEVLGRLKEIVGDACASDDELIDYVTALLTDDEYRKRKCDHELMDENNALKNRNQSLAFEVDKLARHNSELVARLHELRKQANSDT